MTITASLERTAAATTPAPLLEVRNLRKDFPVHGGIFSRVIDRVQAVQDVSFSIGAGQVLGLVGESGSGKTTVGRSILRLLEPTSGEVIFDGVDITTLPLEQMRQYREADADRLPGSVRQPQSPYDGGRHRRPGHRYPRPRDEDANGRTGLPNYSIASAYPQRISGVIRTNSRVGSASASESRAPSR